MGQTYCLAWGRLLCADFVGQESCKVDENEKVNSRVDFREIVCEDGRWMELAQDRVQWLALVLAVLNSRVLLSNINPNYIFVYLFFERLCALVVRVRFPALPDFFFLRSSGSGTGCTQPRDDN
jgi:hypothetical protein